MKQELSKLRYSYGSGEGEFEIQRNIANSST
jgi:hypothetical protein